MPVSTTSARISAVVPDPHTLTSQQIVDLIAGAKAANINHLTVHVRWNLYQSGGSWWDDQAAAGMTIVYDALQAGMQVGLVLTGPAPTWATRANIAPDFANFAARVAIATRDQCRFMGLSVVPAEYSVWHWPNVSASWGAAPDAAEYTNFLKATYTALKAVNPSAVVILGGLAPVTTVKATTKLSTRPGRTGRGSAAPLLPSEVSPVDFLNAVYAAGGKGYFDVLGYTPVSIGTPQQPKPPAPSGDSIKQSDDLRTVLVTRGDAAKKMHWTIGYDTDLFTQTQQAVYLDTLRWLAETRKDHVAALNIYTYRDPA